MFTVTSLDSSKTLPLINISTNFKMEQGVDGAFLASFTTYKADNNPGYELIEPGNVINVYGYDFRTAQLSVNNGSKTLTAISTFYDLSKVYKHEILEGAKTLTERLNFALNGTGWTYEIAPGTANNAIFAEGVGNSNVVDVVKNICALHEVEYEIQPNNHLVFAKEIGQMEETRPAEIGPVGYRNYFIEKTSMPGYISSSDNGILMPPDEFDRTSDFINVSDWSELTFRVRFEGMAGYANVWVGLYFYDENYDYISAAVDNSIDADEGNYVYELQVPNEASYVRVTANQYDHPTTTVKISVEKGYTEDIGHFISWEDANYPKPDFIYRYKHNIGDVVKEQDTTNLFTKITGYGKDGLTVTYNSPNQSIFGVLEASPVNDESFTDAAALGEYLKTQIQDVPSLVISSTTPALNELALGEKVWLIYEPLNIEMQTRILTQTKTVVDGQLKAQSVTFGNVIPKTFSDIVVDQKKDAIETAKKFRSAIIQTDEMIRLEVERIDESIGAIEIRADQIELSVNNRIDEEVAAINLRSDEIELSVNNRIDSEFATLTTRANAIELSVTNLENYTTSNFSVMSNRIDAKVSKGNIISEINLEPGTATISANKINLNGAVLVNGSITGTGSINVSTDAYVGNNLYLGEDMGGNKTIFFSDTARIDGGEGNIGADMSISALTLDFYTTYINFNNATVTGLSANTVGPFSFAYTSTTALTVYRYGTKIGTIAITP